MNNNKKKMIGIFTQNIINDSNKEIKIEFNKVENIVNNIKKVKKIKHKTINLKRFFEIFIIHMLYSFLFGFLIYIPLFFIYKQDSIKFIKGINLNKFNFKTLYFIFYWITFYFLLFYNFKYGFSMFNPIFIFYYIFLMLIVILNISIEYSTFKKKKYKNLKRGISPKSAELYKNKSDITQNILKEIDNIYIMNDIDKNNFYISFIKNIEYYDEVKFQIHKNNFFAVFNDRLKIKYYSCENIFKYLLTHYSQKVDRFILLKLIFFIIFSNLIFIFYLFYKFKYDIEKIIYLLIKYSLYFLIVLIIKFYFCFYISKILKHFMINNNVLKQINLLIDINYNKKRLFPMINYFDMYSIQNWINIRKLSNEFGSKLYWKYKGIMIIIFFLVLIQGISIVIFSYRVDIKIWVLFNEEIIIEFEDFILKDLFIMLTLFIIILFYLSVNNYNYMYNIYNFYNIMRKINYIKIHKTNYIKILKNKNNKNLNISDENIIFYHSYDKISYINTNNSPDEFNLKIIEFLVLKYKDNIIEEINSYLDLIFLYIKKQILYLQFIKNRKSFKIFGLLMDKNFLKIIIIGLIPYYINFLISYKLRFNK